MSDKVFKALERIASSSWGKQGIGACKSMRMRDYLQKQGWIRVCPKEPHRIVAMTLNGFRALEEERWNRKISERP